MIPGTAKSKNRYLCAAREEPSREGETIMPMLLWVTFWSSLLASAACFGDVARPASAAPDEHQD
jgi:hypothetical protein